MAGGKLSFLIITISKQTNESAIQFIQQSPILSTNNTIIQSLHPKQFQTINLS